MPSSINQFRATGAPGRNDTAGTRSSQQQRALRAPITEQAMPRISDALARTQGLAPKDAAYVVAILNTVLTAERLLAGEASVLTVTDGGAGGAITVGVAANGIGNAKLRDSAAVSVIGRSANSSGDPADIAASTNGHVLQRVSDTVAFGALPSQGRHTIWVPASAMTPATTSGAVVAQLSVGGNPNDYAILEFADGSLLFAHFQIQMPKAWNEGTLTYRVHWTLNSTSTNSAVYKLQGAAISDGETLGPSYGTAISVSDAGLGTARVLHVSAESAALTIAGTPAAEDLCDFRFMRDPTEGGDTLAVTTELIGVSIYYVTSNDNDL